MQVAFNGQQQLHGLGQFRITVNRQDALMGLRGLLGEPVRQFKQSAASEKLTGIRHIHIIQSDTRLGLGHATPSVSAVLAAQSAARKRDSR